MRLKIGQLSLSLTEKVWKKVILWNFKNENDKNLLKKYDFQQTFEIYFCELKNNYIHLYSRF